MKIIIAIIIIILLVFSGGFLMGYNFNRNKVIQTSESVKNVQKHADEFIEKENKVVKNNKEVIIEQKYHSAHHGDIELITKFNKEELINKNNIGIGTGYAFQSLFFSVFYAREKIKIEIFLGYNLILKSFDGGINCNITIYSW